MVKKIMFLFIALHISRSLYAAEFFCASGNVTCLIAAINQANSTPVEDTINLEPGIYTVTMIDNGSVPPPFPMDPSEGANGLPLITSRIIIRGTTAESTVIERDVAAPAFRLLHVTDAGNLTLSGLMLRAGTALSFHYWGGEQEGRGGAVFNGGMLAIGQSILTNNSARGDHSSGGAIFNAGTATITHSTLAANSAVAGRGSGGGALYNTGTLSIAESSLTSNLASALSGSGGAISNQGTATITNTTVAGNTVSGVDSLSGGGGGLSNSGTLTIINSTVTGNSSVNPSSPTKGGGISNSGTLTLRNTILAGNIFTGNTSSVGPDCFGPVTSTDHDLIGDPTGCGITLGPDDLTGDPGLGDFTDNGSAGNGHFPLLVNSQARDRGNPAACPPTDQLGLPRSGTCDIGSIEFQARILVSIDLRPHSDADRINPNSRAQIQVAILTTDLFDASTVNPETVRFGLSGTEAAPRNFRLSDVDHDSDRDMILRFEIEETGVKCGTTSLSLTGETFSGTPIVGSAPVEIVGCKKKK